MIKEEKIFSKINFIIILSLGMIFIGSGIFTLESNNLNAFLQSVWKSFMLIQDPGNLKEFNSLNLSFVPTFDSIIDLSFSIFLTLVGVLFFTILIGLMTNVIEKIMEYDDYSRLRINNHLIIANWDDNYNHLLEEISDYRSIAHNKLRGMAIEISANKNIILLSQKKERNTHNYQYKNIKICRRYGMLYKKQIKKIINYQTSSKIIILSPNQSADTILNMEMSNFISLIADEKNKEFSEKKIIFESKNGHYFESLVDIKKSKDINLEIANTPKIINQIISQLIGNPFIIDIYKELLAYKGNDLYLKNYYKGCEDDWFNSNKKIETFNKNERVIGFFDKMKDTNFLYPSKDIYEKINFSELYPLMIGNFQIDNQDSKNERIKKRILKDNHEHICIIGYNDSIFDFIYEIKDRIVVSNNTNMFMIVL